jgi:hypothetical protein
LRKGGGITLGTHTVGAGVEEVLSTGDPILVGTNCGPQNPSTPHAQNKQVSKETHFRGKRDLLYADF